MLVPYPSASCSYQCKGRSSPLLVALPALSGAARPAACSCQNTSRGSLAGLHAEHPAAHPATHPATHPAAHSICRTHCCMHCRTQPNSRTLTYIVYWIAVYCRAHCHTLCVVDFLDHKTFTSHYTDSLCYCAHIFFHTIRITTALSLTHVSCATSNFYLKMLL